MGCIFSKRKVGAAAAAVDHSKSIDEAILDLKNTRDKLQKYQKQQERCQNLELQKARELIQNKKLDRAKIVLRQKKLREVYINNAEQNIQNIKTQIDNIETKQMELEVVNCMKQTNNILKNLNELMPIEEVEKIMDENQEQADRLNEISDLLAQNMTPEVAQAAEDDYEMLLAELQAEDDSAPIGETNGEEEEHAPEMVSNKVYAI